MSKELEELKDLKNAFIGHCNELKCEENYIKVCENKFSKIEKELKALEIINKYYIFEENQFYPFKRKNIRDRETKEESDFLKEVLGR